MGKIGNYDYPETSVEECLRVATALVNQFPSGVNDINAFAEAIGHKSSNSGGYLVKIGDVRKYNLMDKRIYKATNMAEIIVNPKNDAEKNEALKTMIYSVALFKQLHDRLRTKSPTIEQLRTQLIDLTSDRNAASRDAEKIRKVYINAMTYIKDSTEMQKRPSENVEDTMNNSTMTLPQGSEDLMIFRAGKINLALPKDDSHIDILISVLNKMRSKSKGK